MGNHNMQPFQGKKTTETITLTVLNFLFIFRIKLLLIKQLLT